MQFSLPPFPPRTCPSSFLWKEAIRPSRSLFCLSLAALLGEEFTTSNKCRGSNSLNHGKLGISTIESTVHVKRGSVFVESLLLPPYPVIAAAALTERTNERTARNGKGEKTNPPPLYSGAFAFLRSIWATDRGAAECENSPSLPSPGGLNFCYPPCFPPFPDIRIRKKIYPEKGKCFCHPAYLKRSPLLGMLLALTPSSQTILSMHCSESSAATYLPSSRSISVCSSAKEPNFSSSSEER